RREPLRSEQQREPGPRPEAPRPPERVRAQPVFPAQWRQVRGPSPPAWFPPVAERPEPQRSEPAPLREWSSAPQRATSVAAGPARPWPARVASAGWVEDGSAAALTKPAASGPAPRLRAMPQPAPRPVLEPTQPKAP